MMMEDTDGSMDDNSFGRGMGSHKRARLTDSSEAQPQQGQPAPHQMNSSVGIAACATGAVRAGERIVGMDPLFCTSSAAASHAPEPVGPTGGAATSSRTGVVIPTATASDVAVPVLRPSPRHAPSPPLVPLPGGGGSGGANGSIDLSLPALVIPPPPSLGSSGGRLAHHRISVDGSETGGALAALLAFGEDGLPLGSGGGSARAGAAAGSSAPATPAAAAAAAAASGSAWRAMAPHSPTMSALRRVTPS